MALGTNAELDVLNFLFRNTAMPTYGATAQRKLSVHTADPGQTGANEATGGSYARQNVSFNAAASRATAMSAAVEFASMPAGTFTHLGVWTDDGTPKFLGALTLGSSVTLTSGNTLRITAATVSFTG